MFIQPDESKYAFYEIFGGGKGHRKSLATGLALLVFVRNIYVAKTPYTPCHFGYFPVNLVKQILRSETIEKSY